MANKEKRYRAEVTGVGETSWSNNAMTYETKQEAKDWLDGLAFRWTGYDAGRVVEDTVEKGEAFDESDERIYQNFR
jgi:hypothetical protein